MSRAPTRVVVALGLLVGLALGPACAQRDDQVVILVAASLVDVAAELVDAWGGDAVGFAGQVLSGADSLEDDARTVLAKVSSRAFVTFLRSPNATEIWRSHGFVPITDP